MQTIFISYRRSDTGEQVGRITDRLVQHFGRNRIFRDVDSIPLNSFYRPYILETVRQSVVLALIGRSWTSCTDDDGMRRLDAPTDLVRQEIETAIQTEVPLIPVILSNASTPRAKELPDSLASLVQRQTHRVRSDPDFHPDMDVLIHSLVPLVEQARDSGAPPADMLKGILADCQGWHTEVIETLSAMALEMGRVSVPEEERLARVRSVAFVYQNTRKYLPRIVSAQGVLCGYAATVPLQDAIRDFLSALTHPARSGQTDNGSFPPANPYLSIAPRIVNPDACLMEVPRMITTNLDQIARDAGISLPHLNAALQRISNEVAALAAQLAARK